MMWAFNYLFSHVRYSDDMSPVSGVAVDAMAFCEVDFSKFVVSFAAQLFTVPLVAYRFGTFSFYSAWATLVISPLTALLIYGMPLILLSGITGIGTTVCAWWIARLGTWQNDCLRAMMEWPYAVAHTDWSLWFYGMVLCGYCVFGVMPFFRLLYPTGTIRTYECDIDFVCLCCKQAILQDPTGNRVL